MRPITPWHEQGILSWIIRRAAKSELCSEIQRPLLPRACLQGWMCPQWGSLWSASVQRTLPCRARRMIGAAVILYGRGIRMFRKEISRQTFTAQHCLHYASPSDDLNTVWSYFCLGLVTVQASFHLIDLRSGLHSAPTSPHDLPPPPHPHLPHTITHCALQWGENTCFDSYNNWLSVICLEERICSVVSEFFALALFLPHAPLGFIWVCLCVFLQQSGYVTICVFESAVSCVHGVQTQIRGEMDEVSILTPVLSLVSTVCSQQNNEITQSESTPLWES